MAAKSKVLFDLNVVLDVLQKREPFFNDSARALSLTENGTLEGWIAAHSVTTLFYLYAKAFSGERARVVLADLMQILAIAPIDQRIVEQALILPYGDFEDAVQMMAAVQVGADYVVTRNPNDFKAGPLPAVRPSELNTVIGLGD
ncbi:MAG: PIN domain-containing protein [Caldilineales bacterium]|nr:PIN domain-containing protein [Caldilineales bacterium]